MSIINDALKKVQDSLRHGSEQKPADNSSTPPQPQTPESYTGGPTGSNGSSEFAAMAPIPTPSSETVNAVPSPENIPAAASAKSTAIKTAPNKMIYIAGAVCLLIALFAPIVNKQSVFGMLTNPKGKSAATPAATVRTQSKTSSSSVSQKAASIKEELARSLRSFNNPGASSAAQQTPSGKKVVLSGILAQGDKNVALIDGQVYEAGETIDRVKIVAINSNNIVIEEGGEQRTLKVGQ